MLNLSSFSGGSPPVCIMKQGELEAAPFVRSDVFLLSFTGGTNDTIARQRAAACEQPNKWDGDPVKAMIFVVTFFEKAGSIAVLYALQDCFYR